MQKQTVLFQHFFPLSDLLSEGIFLASQVPTYKSSKVTEEIFYQKIYLHKSSLKLRLFSSSGEGKRFEKGRKKLEKTTSGTASGTDKKHQGRALIASGTDKKDFKKL